MSVATVEALCYCSVVHFSLAVSRWIKDPSGERHEETQ
jgi:hypothetical protein